MDFFEFIRWLLIIIVSVTLLPICIPLAALAFRIHLGDGKLPFTRAAFWWRSTGAALGLALLSLVVLVLDHLIVTAEVPAGVVHLTLMLVYVPTAMSYLHWMYALNDWLDCVGLFVIYIGLPGFLLAAIVWLGSFRLPISLAESWLAPVI